MCFLFNFTYLYIQVRLWRQICRRTYGCSTQVVKLLSQPKSETSAQSLGSNKFQVGFQYQVHWNLFGVITWCLFRLSYGWNPPDWWDAKLKLVCGNWYQSIIYFCWIKFYVGTSQFYLSSSMVSHFRNQTSIIDHRNWGDHPIKISYSTIFTRKHDDEQTILHSYSVHGYYIFDR